MKAMRIGMILAIAVVSRCDRTTDANYGDQHIEIPDQVPVYDKFYWPTTGKITQDFFGHDSVPDAGWWIDIDGSLKYHNGGSNFHRALDIENARGTKIYSATYGYVTIHAGGPSGNAVVVKSGAWLTKYDHLESFNVSNGEFVTPNTVIGFMGSTGGQSYPHLHFSYQVVRDRQLADCWIEGVPGQMIVSGVPMAGPLIK